MPPARVLHLIDSGGVYGAERVILNLAREHQAGGQVVPVVGCLVPRRTRGNELIAAAAAAGIETLQLPVSNLRLPLDLLRLTGVIRRKRIDLVHAHGYKPAVFAFALHVLAGVPVTSTCHLWFEPEKAPIKKRLMVWLEKHAYRRFPRVLAVSEDIRATLVAGGVDASRIEVVSNGVDVQPAVLTATERTRLRQALGIRDGEFCVLNAARLTRQKAQWLLVEAAAQLQSAGFPCKVLIVGSGELEAELREQIARLGVGDTVRLLGFRDDVGSILQASDAFALPSLDEGMPMSLLEAAAARLPIIATPVGDIGKLIVDGQSGLVIRPGEVGDIVEAIRRLRDQPAEAKAQAERAYRTVAEVYSSQAMARRHLGIYAGLLEAGAHGTAAAGPRHE